MTPAPAGSEPGGFELGPEVWLLGLGVFATAVIILVFVWLLRGMIREDREQLAAEAQEKSQAAGEQRKEDE